LQLIYGTILVSKTYHSSRLTSLQCCTGVREGTPVVYANSRD